MAKTQPAVKAETVQPSPETTVREFRMAAASRREFAKVLAGMPIEHFSVPEDSALNEAVTLRVTRN